MPDYAVSTAFNGRDKVSHLFDQMGKAAHRFETSGKRAFRGVGQEADHASTALRNATKHGYNFAAIVKGILAANAIRGGIGYVTGGLQNIGQQYLQFGDVMTGAVARFQEVDLRSAAFGQQIDTLGKQVRGAMAGTRYAAVDGAKALNELAKAGYTSVAGVGILPNMIAFATSAQEDLAQATLMSSDILGGFGMRSKDVQEQLKNHIRLNDMLTKSALMATGDLRDMFETMKVVAPLSTQKGVMPETVIAMATALSNAGIKGDIAATAIKRGFMNFYGPRMQEELRANGVNPYDAQGNRRKITDVYADFARAVGKLRPEAQEEAFARVFQIYGAAGNVKIVQELAKIAEYEDELRRANGVSEEMARAANTSPLAKLIKVGNAIMEKGFQVLDEYAGKGGKGPDMLLGKIQKFDVRPLIDAITLTGKALWTLYRVAEPFIPMMPYLVGGFVAWKVAMAGLGLVRFVSSVTEAVWAVGLLEGVLAGGGLAAGLWAVAAPVAALTANFLIWREVAKSLQGGDNMISKAAQWMGLVPKLATDADGNVIGRSTDQYGWTPWDAGDAAPVAQKTAEARTKRDWRGYLQFGNLPEGSTINNQPVTRNVWEFGNLGAN